METDFSLEKRRKTETTTVTQMVPEPTLLPTETNEGGALTRPTECPVCYETLELEKPILECRHWICFDCLQRWIQATCPICRQPHGLKPAPLQRTFTEELDELVRELDRETEIVTDPFDPNFVPLVTPGPSVAPDFIPLSETAQDPDINLNFFQASYRPYSWFGGSPATLPQPASGDGIEYYLESDLGSESESDEENPHGDSFEYGDS